MSTTVYFGGKITDSVGNPLPDILVKAYNINNEVIGQERTNSIGNYGLFFLYQNTFGTTTIRPDADYVFDPPEKKWVSPIVNINDPVQNNIDRKSTR